MATISTSCPQCRATYRVPSEHAGKKARCTKCNTVFVVPQAEPDAARPLDEPVGFVACRYCGFHGSGNFCSNCGGRLTGAPDYDFERCKVPASFLSQLPADFAIELFGTDPKRQEEQRREYEIRQSCQRFNEGLEEMGRQVKYEGVKSGGWRFSRLQVGRMLDQLPEVVPGREAIISRLWTIVSDIERASRNETIDELLENIESNLAHSNVKLASKEIDRLHETLKDAPDPALAKKLEAFNQRIQKIDEEARGERQIAAFRKLLDKADKLAFQGESKKAVKAYQECLFWLSRNDLPNKETVEADAQEKVSKAQLVIG